MKRLTVVLLVVCASAWAEHSDKSDDEKKRAQPVVLTPVKAAQLVKDLGDEEPVTRSQALRILSVYLRQDQRDERVVKEILASISALGPTSRDIRHSGRKLLNILVDYTKEAESIEKKAYENAALPYHGLADGLQKVLKGGAQFNADLKAYLLDREKNQKNPALWADLKTRFTKLLTGSSPDITEEPRAVMIYGVQPNGKGGIDDYSVSMAILYKGKRVGVNYSTYHGETTFSFSKEGPLNVEVKPEDAISAQARSTLEMQQGKKLEPLKLSFARGMSMKVTEDAAHFEDWNWSEGKPTPESNAEEIRAYLGADSLGLLPGRGDRAIVLTELSRKKPKVGNYSRDEYKRAFPEKPAPGGGAPGL